jgi:hypothetical protein
MDRFAVVNGSETFASGPVLPRVVADLGGGKIPTDSPVSTPFVAFGEEGKKTPTRRRSGELALVLSGQPSEDRREHSLAPGRTHSNLHPLYVRGRPRFADRFDFCLSRRSGERF